MGEVPTQECTSLLVLFGCNLTVTITTTSQLGQTAKASFRTPEILLQEPPKLLPNRDAISAD
jgi:hypothetical protein